MNMEYSIHVKMKSASVQEDTSSSWIHYYFIPCLYSYEVKILPVIIPTHLEVVDRAYRAHDRISMPCVLLPSWLQDTCLTLSDLVYRAIMIHMHVDALRVVVHGHHAAGLDDAVLLGEIGFGE